MLSPKVILVLSVVAAAVGPAIAAYTQAPGGESSSIRTTPASIGQQKPGSGRTVPASASTSGGNTHTDLSLSAPRGSKPHPSRPPPNSVIRKRSENVYEFVAREIAEDLASGAYSIDNVDLLTKRAEVLEMYARDGSFEELD